MARAVFIINKEGILRNIQDVKDIEDEPDYESVLKAVKELLKEKTK